MTRGIACWSVVLAAAGCATTETTEPEPIPVYGTPVEARIAVGRFLDQRLREKGGDLTQKQILLSPAKVKNAIVDVLSASGRFREVVNLPAEEGEATVASMVYAANRSNCDYLIVGEIDQFEVIDLGANPRMTASVMLETATFPVGIIVFLMSDRKSGFWVNSIIYDRTAMAALSLTLHVLDLKEEQGRTLAHLSNVVSLATRPINVLAYGDLSNPADDWIDLGKELGLVAIHNAGVKLAERLGVVVESLVGRR